MFDIQKIKELEEELKKLSLTNYMDEIGAEFQNGRWFCPFHDETNPSLSIDEDQGIWHCFSCGKGGGYGKLVFEYSSMNDDNIKIYYQALEEYLKTHRELSDRLGFSSMKDGNYNRIIRSKEGVLEFVYGIKPSPNIIPMKVELNDHRELTPDEIVDKMYKLQYKL